MEGGGVEELCWGRERGGGAVRRKDYRGVYNIRSSSAFVVAEQIFARPGYFSKQILEKFGCSSIQFKTRVPFTH